MNIDTLSVNTIRFLCAEAVQKANSGHPGLPLGAAPAAYTLWAKQMKHNPKNPKWINRDRFVLSAGHGSSLLYSLLHLTGYGLSIEDLHQFRQLDSKTPGHPEFGHTVGVEVTTGPLGQGIANGVGMALAEKHLAAKFNKKDFPITDHFTFVLCGDGCLMEGISHEAISLAGTWGLNKLIVLYDSNNITIEGNTNIAFTENVQETFKACHWNVITVKDGNDMEAIEKAIDAAKKQDKPTLIEIKTQIGYGAPNKQGKASAHGEPLGKDELALAKKTLEWSYTEEFHVPQEVRQHMSNLETTWAEEENKWNQLMEEYRKAYPEEAKQWDIWHNPQLPVDLLNMEDFWEYEGNMATRASSGKVLNKLADMVPNLFGGSADLAPSNKSYMDGKGDFSQENPTGMNLHFGVREHAMTAIANGLAIHGGLRPYVAGFFVFSDYMKPSLRLASLMNLPIISIMTHDSIGVGEDGPTHQPIEHLVALRSIPNHTVIRPCDAKEVAAAWYLALTRTNSPTTLVLSRQNTLLLKETGKEALKGGYVLKDAPNGKPNIILMATGTEVELIYQAYDILVSKGHNPRVVSMPCFEVFEEQPQAYKEKVLPKSVRNRLAVEAASPYSWGKYVGLDGDVIGMSSFGASAPAEQLYEKFGFTVENIVNKAIEIITKNV